MSTQYNGKPANVSVPAAINITSSTGTTPISITAAAHGLTSGDFVLVSNHAVNTSANGIWQVTVDDANTFRLLTSVFTAAGAATGTVQPLTLSPTFATPSDGDDMSAASVNVALDATGDRTSYLGVRSGAWRVVQRTFVNPADTSEPASNLTTWAQTTYAAGAFKVVSFTSFGLVAGDVVQFRGQISLAMPANTNACYVKAQRDIAGSGATDFGNRPRIEFVNAAAAAAEVSMPLFFEETLAANTVSNQYNVYLIARNATSGGTIALLSNSTFELTVLRSNA